MFEAKFSYSAPEVADMLGVGLPKVHRWIKSGELKTRNLRGARSGDRPRYSILARDLEAFLDARTVRKPPQQTTRRLPPSDVPEYV